MVLNYKRNLFENINIRLNKLIKNKNVFEEVRNKPYSVILLDEIEKCSPNILDLFLQILDEGKVKDSKGNIIRFDNTIIIMTSNVGSDKKHVGFNHKENDYSTSLKSYFGVPFLNRINKTIYVNSITEEVIDKIINKVKTADTTINTIFFLLISSPPWMYYSIKAVEGQ